MANRNLSGWKRQAYDPRDYQHRVPRKLLAALPDYFDLSPKMGPQRDQKTLGACGPFTLDECVMAEQIAQGLSPTGASPLFVYWTTRFLMDTVNEDSGVNNRDMLRAAAGYGYPSEAEYPYDVKKFKDRPPAAVIASAAKNKITSYAAVAKDLKTMKGTLVGGDPFIFGFDVFEQLQSDQCAKDGIVFMPRTGEPSIGGHDVSIVGYNDSGHDRLGVLPGNIWPAGTFKFRNHWVEDDGRPWGDGGYGYMPFAYATGSHADDFWVINSVPGSVPTPPPSPVPVPPKPPEPPVSQVLTIPVPEQPCVIFGAKLGHVPAYTLEVPLPAVAHANPNLKLPPMPDWLKAWLKNEFEKVWPIVSRDLIAVWMGTKTWEDVGKDVLAALGIGVLVS